MNLIQAVLNSVGHESVKVFRDWITFLYCEKIGRKNISIISHLANSLVVLENEREYLRLSITTAHFVQSFNCERS